MTRRARSAYPNLTRSLDHTVTHSLTHSLHSLTRHQRHCQYRVWQVLLAMS
jgi:hypothetical protein